ncbi:MAG: cytochrome c-type biogenesis CcmF C-terminal domain-containing protein [Desulfovermiculus sp.]
MTHSIGFYSLLAAMSLSLVACAWIAYLLWQGRTEGIRRIAWLQSAVFGLVLVPSIILAVALLQRDFSFLVVAEYTDSLLPWAYALTAFWAGQEGSFLFWTLAVTFFGLAWSLFGAGKDMPPQNACAFWLMYTLVQAFFLLIATTVSNPMVQLAPPPADGNGLNPLLQHPGMIFHPPLLFIGYAGLTVPAAAGLGTILAADESWLDRVRNWTLVAWTFLTAGIVLGAWWSYMELGWGGYWAWDPVENASLIPWLACSAFVHTAVIGRKGRALGRSNVALAGLSLVLCLLATFVTRSGMLDSLHAFGSQGVGLPLIWAMVVGTVLLALGGLGARTALRRRMSFIASQQGGIVLLTWLLLILAAVIGLGTLWPLISKIWTPDSVGMGPSFYNRVCLPFLSLIIVGLPLCPWLGWTTWNRYYKVVLAVLGGAGLLGVWAWSMGIRDILPLVTVAFALAAIPSLLAYCVYKPTVRRSLPQLAVMGIHLGLAVMALGIALSGPYKQEKDAVLSPGQELRLGEYLFTYTTLDREQTQRMEAYKAHLEVSKEGKDLGELVPERRFYRSFDQPFAEASVLPGLGDELYATLLGFNQDRQVRVQIRINPGVNWIWIGGTIMCLAGLFTVRRTGRRRQAEA